MYRFVLALTIVCGLFFHAVNATALGFEFPADGSPVTYAGSWIPTDADINVFEPPSEDCDDGIEMWIYDIEQAFLSGGTDFSDAALLFLTDGSKQNADIDQTATTLDVRGGGSVDTGADKRFGFFFVDTNTSETFLSYNVNEAVPGSIYIIELINGKCLTVGIDACPDGVIANPIPVPGAVWLLGAGMAGLLGLRRRR